MHDPLFWLTTCFGVVMLWPMLAMAGSLIVDRDRIKTDTTTPRERNIAYEIAAIFPALTCIALEHDPLLDRALLGIALSVLFLSVAGILQATWWGLKKAANFWFL